MRLLSLPMSSRWLCENLGLLHSALASLADAKVALTRSVYVRYSGQVAPRVLVIAEDLLASLDYRFGDSEFSIYLQAMQRTVVLRLDELRAMPPALSVRAARTDLVGLANLVSGKGSELLATGIATARRSIEIVYSKSSRDRSGAVAGTAGAADSCSTRCCATIRQALTRTWIGEPGDVSRRRG